MQKMGGRICDCCRTVFRPGDVIYELCSECAQVVWCVTNIYEDGSKELSSVHHTEEKAKEWMESTKDLLTKINLEKRRKIIDRTITSWFIL
jgi:hypothetical protein